MIIINKNVFKNILVSYFEIIISDIIQEHANTDDQLNRTFFFVSKTIWLDAFAMLQIILFCQSEA